MLTELRARISSIQGRPSDIGELAAASVHVAESGEPQGSAAGLDLSGGADTAGRSGQGTIATHRGLAHLVRLRAGASYAVDSASLALALLAGASAGGSWVAAVGWQDFGIEAAQQYGADLSRMVVVPDPGDDWVEVTAALVDVVGLVAVRAPNQERIAPSRASVLSARLRSRAAAMVVWGHWPQSTAQLSMERIEWSGLAHGSGRLTTRSAQVAVSHGAAPPIRGTWEQVTVRQSSDRAAATDISRSA